MVGNVNIISLAAHPHFLSQTHTHTHIPKSYHRWVCCPCGVTTPLGFGRTRSSRGWSLPPPEGIAPDTPGPGMSLVTPISPPHGRPTEYFQPPCSPSRLCGQEAFC